MEQDQIQVQELDQPHVSIRGRIGQCVSSLRPAKRWQILEIVAEPVPATEQELARERELLAALWRRGREQS